MDMNTATFHDIADHRDEAISFERAATGRKIETIKAATHAPCGEGWYHDAAIEDANHDAIEARSNPYHH